MEKTLVKSERYSVVTICLIVIALGVIASVIWFGFDCSNGMERYYRIDGYHVHDSSCYYEGFWGKCPRLYSSALEAGMAYVKGLHGAAYILPTLFMAVISIIVYAWMRSYEIVVTNKRVYGFTAFSKRIDLPIDSVSAIGSSAFNGISVSTSSGRISFMLIKNRNEIHRCISDLLIERQKKNSVVASAAECRISNPDELKKYKELLDSGVITKEEFNAKKKQLLDL